MKTILKSMMLMALITSFTAFAAVVEADGQEGGGGDQMVVQFIKVAEQLLSENFISEQDKAILRNALTSTRIVSVDVLKNPLTGEPIPNQRTVVAWGSPNLIQLKLSSGAGGEASWESLESEGKSLGQYVFHELYRASGEVGPNGRSPDDTFQISIGKYKLGTYNPYSNVSLIEVCGEQTNTDHAASECVENSQDHKLPSSTVALCGQFTMTGHSLNQCLDKVGENVISLEVARACKKTTKSDHTWLECINKNGRYRKTHERDAGFGFVGEIGGYDGKVLDKGLGRPKFITYPMIENKFFIAKDSNGNGVCKMFGFKEAVKVDYSQAAEFNWDYLQTFGPVERIDTAIINRKGQVASYPSEPKRFIEVITCK